MTAKGEPEKPKDWNGPTEQDMEIEANLSDIETRASEQAHEEPPQKKKAATLIEINNIKVYQCEDCGQVMFSTWDHNADHTIATIFDSSKIREETLEQIKAQVQALRPADLTWSWELAVDEKLDEVVALLDKMEAEL